MTLATSDAIMLGGFLECTFYGVYVVLFILYLVLRRRNNHGVNRPLTLAHILLFSLCTLSFSLDVPWDYLK
ncbi:hypothetical protein BD779DRAFT_1545985 [Infundibulicybe gibba]|nr:hypothetical protein BD779DRAFT_1545985 [Infundibulicybe gibba]